jgi:hypothetical protein
VTDTVTVSASVTAAVIAPASSVGTVLEGVVLEVQYADEVRLCEERHAEHGLGLVLLKEFFGAPWAFEASENMCRGSV